MFVEVLGYFPAVQVVRHVVPSRYLVPVQVRQSLDVASLQVAHVESHESHVLVAALGKVLEGQVIKQLVPLKYLPIPESQLKHPDAVPLLQVTQVESQLSQVLVPVFPYFPLGHVVRQLLPSKNLGDEQVKQSVLRGPLQVPQVESQLSHVLVATFSYFPAEQLNVQLVPSKK